MKFFEITATTSSTVEVVALLEIVKVAISEGGNTGSGAIPGNPEGSHYSWVLADVPTIEIPTGP
jgi:hypothetical protein